MTGPGGCAETCCASDMEHVKNSLCNTCNAAQLAAVGNYNLPCWTSSFPYCDTCCSAGVNIFGSSCFNDEYTEAACCLKTISCASDSDCSSSALFCHAGTCTKCCNAIKLSGFPENMHATRDGIFFKMEGISQNDFPVYQNKDGEYLYYWGSEWLIGSHYTTTDVGVHSLNAYNVLSEVHNCPDAISSWKLYDRGDFKIFKDVSATCVDPLTIPIPTKMPSASPVTSLPSASPVTSFPTIKPTRRTINSRFFTMVGDCDVRGDCVSSSNYPEGYEKYESCTVTMVQDVFSKAGKTFEVYRRDNLMIRGKNVETLSAIPVILKTGEAFTWESGRRSRKGWEICFSDETDSDSRFFVMIGDCDVRDDCVSSSNYPSHYENEESCTVTMLQDASLKAGETLELYFPSWYDSLMIRGKKVGYDQTIPDTLKAGEQFTWTSNRWVTKKGWQICFSDKPTSISHETSVGEIDSVAQSMIDSQALDIAVKGLAAVGALSTLLWAYRLCFAQNHAYKGFTPVEEI